MKNLILILLSLVITTHARAEIKTVTPLVPPGPVSAWEKSFKANARKLRDPKSLTECRDVSGLPGATLCLFSTMERMQWALLRASVFIEGQDSLPAGIVYSHKSKDLNQTTAHVSGVDLKGEDLLKFYAEVNRQCEASHRNPDICLSKYEREIFDGLILPATAKQQPFVIIAAGLISRADLTGTISHEIMHAQYFLQPEFREVTDNFWESFTNEQRAYIKQMLFMYDQSNDYLMRNEFQAYLLQAGAERTWLNSLVEKTRPKLIALLAARGLSPIQIQ